MGVSGSGKSHVGAALARACGVDFVEGDDLHPPANIAKMSAGIPLDDADRRPWLEAIAAAIAVHRGQGVVVACSALRRIYRDHLRQADPALRLLYLRVPRDELARRMGRRRHFMPPALLDSQLATLEEPAADERAIVLEAGADLAVTVASATQALRSSLRPA
ncbi:gluconokinase [Rhodanobacter hydrolyticus]|uniref:Gluconokinase n=2 Tax=Rhodanobacteraceae TaxID=1775411 RepID=A0ABW8JE86_9GAMM|nr:gluconokinase [Rhodanobacter sp. 7MK24]